jgi:hypothetical protein
MPWPEMKRAGLARSLEAIQHRGLGQHDIRGEDGHGDEGGG